MNLEIPEGTNVHIVIGAAPPLALTDQRSQSPVKSPRRGLLGTTLKAALVGIFVIGGFWIGEQRGQATNEGSGFAAPPPVNQAFPGQAIAPNQAAAPPSPAAPGELPPNFAAQLQTPPTIQPPPGQTGASGGDNKNAFGLSN